MTLPLKHITKEIQDICNELNAILTRLDHINKNTDKFYTKIKSLGIPDHKLTALFNILSNWESPLSTVYSKINTTNGPNPIPSYQTFNSDNTLPNQPLCPLCLSTNINPTNHSPHHHPNIQCNDCGFRFNKPTFKTNSPTPIIYTQHKQPHCPFCSSSNISSILHPTHPDLKIQCNDCNNIFYKYTFKANPPTQITNTWHKQLICPECSSNDITPTKPSVPSSHSMICKDCGTKFNKYKLKPIPTPILYKPCPFCSSTNTSPIKSKVWPGQKRICNNCGEQFFPFQCKPYRIPIPTPLYKDPSKYINKYKDKIVTLKSTNSFINQTTPLQIKLTGTTIILPGRLTPYNQPKDNDNTPIIFKEDEFEDIGSSPPIYPQVHPQKEPTPFKKPPHFIRDYFKHHPEYLQPSSTIPKPTISNPSPLLPKPAQDHNKLTDSQIKFIDTHLTTSDQNLINKEKPQDQSDVHYSLFGKTHNKPTNIFFRFFKYLF